MTLMEIYHQANHLLLSLLYLLLAVFLQSHQIIVYTGKVKLSLYQTVEAHRALRRRGSHIF
jgi:predicted permease